jgi:hypothetical protein
LAERVPSTKDLFLAQIGRKRGNIARSALRRLSPIGEVARLSANRTYD